jgi:hypothetical protein
MERRLAVQLLQARTGLGVERSVCDADEQVTDSAHRGRAKRFVIELADRPRHEARRVLPVHVPRDELGLDPLDDLTRLLLFAIENKALQGVYNAVAPQPVSNKDLVLKMGAQKGFYIPVPVPAFALKVALGEMSIEVLKSATVSSQKIEAEGFTFQYPTVDEAVRQLK